MSRAAKLTQFATAYDTGGISQFKNRIINGAMMIDQRNVGASVTPNSDGYVLDRFCQFQSVSSKLAFQQNGGGVTPPPGFSKYVGITVVSAVPSLSAGDYYGFEQRIEGNNIFDLGFGTSNAQPVTFSFWVRSNLTGTFGGTLKTAPGSTTACYAYTYTINAANTWEYKTVTIPGATIGTWPTDNSFGMRAQFALGVGSTYSKAAGSWSSTDAISATGATSIMGSVGNYLYLTGIDLRKGVVGAYSNGQNDFEYRLHPTELQICKRYYQTYGSASVGDMFLVALIRYATYINGYIGIFTFPVEMRAAPTITNSCTQFHKPGIIYDTVSSKGSGNITPKQATLTCTPTVDTTTCTFGGFFGGVIELNAEL